MDHATYRRAVSGDAPLSAPARDHAAGCEDCRTWTDALDALRHDAPSLGGEPPADLSARVLSAAGIATAAPTLTLDQPAAATQPPAFPTTGAPTTGVVVPLRRFRPGLGAVASLAAAAVGLASIAVLMRGGEAGRGDAVAVLGAAAAAVGSDGTGYRFTLEGSIESEVDLGPLGIPDQLPVLPELPELPGLPDFEGIEGLAELPALPELPGFEPLPFPGDVGAGIDIDGFCAGLPEVAIQACLDATADITIEGATQDEFRRSLEEAQAEMQRALEAGQDEIRRALEEAQAGLSAAMIEARDGLVAARDELQRVTGQMVESLDRAGDMRIEFTGRGEGNGEGDLSAEIGYAFGAPVEANGALEVITVAGTSYVRDGDTPGWVSMPGTYDGFAVGELSAPRDLDTLLSELRRPGAEIEELGDDTRDGVAVRGLRFAGHAGATVSAWVGIDDGLLREVHWVRQHGDETTPVRVRAETTIRFTDLGADVTIEAPVDATPLSEAPRDLLPPFDASLGVDLTLDLDLTARPAGE